MLWIYFTLLAATMQAVRTAGQKQLSRHLNAMATTAVRYFFALPFAWVYLWAVTQGKALPLPELNGQFLYYALIACVTQILGTAFLVIAFRYRNFAVATSLAKTEAIQVAIVGVLLFAAPLSAWGWCSVIIGVIAVLLLSKVKFRLADIIANPGAGFGLAAGLALAITTLLIRESSLALHSDLMLSAAVTLAFMISVQSLLSLLYLCWRDVAQLRAMHRHWRLCLFVGITSVLGSIGWFTGASYQNAAYVKALGQVEFFITLLITHRIFKERISLGEYFGMILLLLSVMVLLLWA